MQRNDKFNELFEKFSGLVFDEATHKYTYEGRRLMSVTTYIKEKYIAPFDSWKIASILASKGDKPAYYWIEYWKLLGAEASAIGSRVHYFAAWYTSTSKPKDAREAAVQAFYEEVFADGWEIVATEMMVYNSSLAGTLDLLLYKEGQYWLIDFKTNKKDLMKDKIEFRDGKSKPLIEQYKMQLALYEHLLGLGKINKSVVHIEEGAYNIIDCN